MSDEFWTLSWGYVTVIAVDHNDNFATVFIDSDGRSSRLSTTRVDIDELRPVYWTFVGRRILMNGRIDREK